MFSLGDEVTYEVTLEATHCVPQRDFTIHVGPSGLDETLLLNVHVLCDCDCENEVRGMRRGLRMFACIRSLCRSSIGRPNATAAISFAAFANVRPDLLAIDANARPARFPSLLSSRNAASKRMARQNVT